MIRYIYLYEYHPYGMNGFGTVQKQGEQIKIKTIQGKWLDIAKNDQVLIITGWVQWDIAAAGHHTSHCS